MVPPPRPSCTTRALLEDFDFLPIIPAGVEREGWLSEDSDSLDDDVLSMKRTILAMGPSPRALTAYTEDDALLPARLAAKRASTQQQQATQEVTSAMSTRWLVGWLVWRARS